MRKEIEIQQEYLQELFKLIKENPDLPIVPMVDGEVVGGDEYGYWVGKFGKARVDEYLMPRDGREDDGIYFKSDDDVYDVLERYLPEEEWEALPESESTVGKGNHRIYRAAGYGGEKWIDGRRRSYRGQITQEGRKIKWRQIIYTQRAKCEKCGNGQKRSSIR